MKKLNNKFVTMYDDAATVRELTDNALIFINEVKEMQNFAGYIVKFFPLSGNYTKYLRDVYITDDGYFGKIGYAQYLKLIERVDNPIEDFLNRGVKK